MELSVLITFSLDGNHDSLIESKLKLKRTWDVSDKITGGKDVYITPT